MGLGDKDLKIYFITSTTENGIKWIEFIIIRKINKFTKDDICLFFGRNVKKDAVKNIISKAFGMPFEFLDNDETFTDELNMYRFLKKCYVKLSGIRSYDKISFAAEPQTTNKDLFEGPFSTSYDLSSKVTKADDLIANLKLYAEESRFQFQDFPLVGNEKKLEFIIGNDKTKGIVSWDALVDLSMRVGTAYLQETEAGKLEFKNINDEIDIAWAAADAKAAAAAEKARAAAKAKAESEFNARRSAYKVDHYDDW